MSRTFFYVHLNLEKIKKSSHYNINKIYKNIIFTPITSKFFGRYQSHVYLFLYNDMQRFHHANSKETHQEMMKIKKNQYLIVILQ